MTAAFTILLVEDSPDDALFFQRALRRASLPFTCQHVFDGKAALEILERARTENRLPAAAMFLDLKMPVMNGFEVLEWLQLHLSPSQFPVFVLSGSDQECDRERARALGAADYLVKPITSEVLKEKLRPIQDAAGVSP